MRRLIAALVFVLGAAVLDAQPRSLLQQSNARARAVLDRALAAHGGLDALRSIRTIWLDEAGQVSLRTQGPLPGRPLTPRRVRNVTMIDVPGNRGCEAPDPFTHSDTTRIEDMFYVWHPRTVVKDGAVTTMSMWMRTRSEPRPGNLQELRTSQRRLPTTWLLEARAAARTLRDLGEETIDRQPTAVIGFTAADGRSVTMRVGRDGLVHSLVSLNTDPSEGDYQSVVTFSEYRRSGGVMVPGRRTEDQDADRTYDMRATRLSINEGVDEGCFEVPSLFSMSKPATRSTAETIQLADGVHLLNGLGGAYNALAVVFEDFVMVIEAPEASPPLDMSAQAIARIRKVAGDKPIRYLAFTHFHTDHGGGVRDYIAEGATILTTAGTRAWVEQSAQARFEMVPDRLTLDPKPLRVETVADRHVVEDATQRVEFHLAPWDHAREEIIFYLPKARLVFEGDLFASGEGEAPIAQRSADLIADTIRDRGLVVERIVGVHGRVRPIADLEQARARRRQLLRID
jgi:glyoxylase-like metal-dependent hydrolase (beta-lactamase superfamily II)